MVAAIALGCGMIGRFVVERLLENGLEVTVVDLNIPEELSSNPKVTALVGDATQHIENFPPQSVIINMLPGRIGDKVRPQLLSAGHNIVDLAFTAEDPHIHQQLAVENNAVLLWDVGIAPGMSNMLAKKGEQALGHLNTLTIKVGGNPAAPDGGWSYMAPFSPSDVIEEYTRPVRIKSNNDVFEVPPITDRHMIQVEGYGEMEAFLTDGLRSVLTTISASNMKEYTVRWPGHIQKWLDSQGVLEESEMLDAWRFDATREEFTWLEVEAKTELGQKRWVVQDSGRDGDGSMARTTGLVTAACALLFLKNGPLHGCGLQPGVHPPEALSTEAIDYVIAMMSDHGVQFDED